MKGIADDTQAAASLSRIWLKCRDSRRETEYQDAVSSDCKAPTSIICSYRTRLLLYTFVLYSVMLLELCCVVVVYQDSGGRTNLTAQLSILLILLCVTALLFALALVKKQYWVRVISQSISFVLTATGFLLLDGHFLARETESGGVREMVDGVIPLILLGALLPGVLMYSWAIFFIVLASACAVAFGLRGGGLDWQSGVLEVGMVFIWLFPVSFLLYHYEKYMKLQFCEEVPEPAPEFYPLRRSKTVVFSSREDVVGTELEDILIKLDKLQLLIHETPVQGDQGQKQWAEDTLEELMNKLATGKNIYQSSIQNKGGKVDAESLAYLEENYVQKGVDEAVARMNSVNDSKSGAAADMSLTYSLAELLPFLHKLGKDWNFNVFFVSQCTDNHALQTCCEFVMNKFNFHSLLQVQEECFKKFFEALATSYKPNPYHNAEHAADVLSSLLYFYSTSELLHNMKDMELLASIFAAAGHDVCHPAVTNRFIVTTRDPLAIVYNDVSVLEMMHCSTTFKLLRETKVLEKLPQESWELVRKVVIEMILATDMSKHFDLLGVFRGLSITDVSFQSFDERLVLFKMCIKSADIGHAAKETSLHELWTARIVEEFFAQGDREKAASLSVSMYCDRDNTDICKAQIGFINVIVMPLFEVMHACLKADGMEEDCVEQLKRNVDHWRAKSVKRRSSMLMQNPDTTATLTTDPEEIKPLFPRSKTALDSRPKS